MLIASINVLPALQKYNFIISLILIVTKRILYIDMHSKI